MDTTLFFGNLGEEFPSVNLKQKFEVKVSGM